MVDSARRDNEGASASRGSDAAHGGISYGARTAQTAVFYRWHPVVDRADTASGASRIERFLRASSRPAPRNFGTRPKRAVRARRKPYAKSKKYCGANGMARIRRHSYTAKLAVSEKFTG
jgi:hypothetical protein